MDIGSQFSRAIKLDGDGRVINFVQNEKCAGGSGKFLQVIARILHMNVEDIGALSLESTNPVEFTTGCAVFAESEAVSRICGRSQPGGYSGGCSQGDGGEDRQPDRPPRPCAGLRRHGRRRQGHRSRADAGNRAGRTMLVPEEPQISAALGAALLGWAILNCQDSRPTGISGRNTREIRADSWHICKTDDQFQEEEP